MAEEIELDFKERPNTVITENGRTTIVLPRAAIRVWEDLIFESQTLLKAFDFLPVEYDKYVSIYLSQAEERSARRKTNYLVERNVKVLPLMNSPLNIICPIGSGRRYWYTKTKELEAQRK